MSNFGMQQLIFLDNYVKECHIPIVNWIITGGQCGGCSVESGLGYGRRGVQFGDTKQGTSHSTSERISQTSSD